MNDRKERTKYMKNAEKDIQMLGPRSVLEGNIVFEGITQRLKLYAIFCKSPQF